jgi:hypothetical protein
MAVFCFLCFPKSKKELMMPSKRAASPNEGQIRPLAGEFGKSSLLQRLGITGPALTWPPILWSKSRSLPPGRWSREGKSESPRVPGRVAPPAASPWRRANSGRRHGPSRHRAPLRGTPKPGKNVSSVDNFFSRSEDLMGTDARRGPLARSCRLADLRLSAAGLISL